MQLTNGSVLQGGKYIIESVLGQGKLTESSIFP